MAITDRHPAWETRNQIFHQVTLGMGIPVEGITVEYVILVRSAGMITDVLMPPVENLVIPY